MKKIYLILSAVFLFNPVLSIIDIFPDCIGYLLLLKVFHKLSYIDDKADELCRNIKVLSLITGIKIICLIIMPSLDQAMYLVFSFVFAILELVFGIPLINKMFDSFSTIALMENSSKEESKTALSCANNEKIKAFTIVAFASRLVLATLPDFTLLSISNGVDTQTGISLVQFRPLLFALSAIISLVIGIVWLALIIKYYNKLITKNAIKALDEYFHSKTKGREALFLSKDAMLFIVLACIGSLFVIDFNLNLVNVFPDSLFSIIITMAFIFLIVKKHIKLSKVFFVVSFLSVLHLATDIYLTVVAIKFFDRYNLNSIEKVSEAEDIYFKLCALAIISAVLFVSVIAFSLYLVNKNAEKTLRENAHLFTGIDTEYCMQEFKRVTRKNSALTIVFALISVSAYISYILFRYIAEATTLINTIAEIAFIVIFIKAMLYLYDNVYKRVLIHS